MTPGLRVSTTMGGVAIVASLMGVLPAPGVVGGTSFRAAASAPAQSDSADAQGTALADFQKRLDAYLELRDSLAQKVKPLSRTPDSAELTARQEALASAMRTARAGAKPGDLIPKPIADRIAATIRADRKRRAPSEKAAALEEVPERPTPAINRTYPADAALPTVPPLLLAQLPKLPDNLQYRFYGRHVVMLDGDLQLITDYVPNVLPPH